MPARTWCNMGTNVATAWTLVWTALRLRDAGQWLDARQQYAVAGDVFEEAGCADMAEYCRALASGPLAGEPKGAQCSS